MQKTHTGSSVVSLPRMRDLHLTARSHQTHPREDTLRQDRPALCRSVEVVRIKGLTTVVCWRRRRRQPRETRPGFRLDLRVRRLPLGWWQARRTRARAVSSSTSWLDYCVALTENVLVGGKYKSIWGWWSISETYSHIVRRGTSSLHATCNFSVGLRVFQNLKYMCVKKDIHWEHVLLVWFFFKYGAHVAYTR